MDLTGAIDTFDRFLGRSDRQIVERVALIIAAEVCGHKHLPEVVLHLRDPRDAAGSLAPHLVAGRGKPTGGSVQNVDCAGVVFTGDPFGRGADSQVLIGAATELTDSQAV